MEFTNVWPRLRPLLVQAERPSRYIDHELGSVSTRDKQAKNAASLCMIYPDTYELGQANQAIRILVNCVNAHENMFAERAYVPALEFANLMQEHKVPLFSLESVAPVREFDLVGITLPHELAISNVLFALDLAEIPLLSQKRSEDDPIIIAGGPCTFNPEPYHLFFDAFLIGEGEESIVEILQCVKKMRDEGIPRADIVRALAQIPGTYVPSLYEEASADLARVSGSLMAPIEGSGAPARIEKRLYSNFVESSAWEPCIVPYTDLVHDRLNVEILRGCSRGCRFCQAGMTYRPVRERSVENIVDAVMKGLEETGYEEVSLTSLSTTDHSQIGQILTILDEKLAGTGVRVSIPSQRLDSFGVEMAALVAGQKRGGLTFAPEAGTQRLRDVINKNVTEEDLMSAMQAAFSEGWRRAKLYFMLGLPTETDEDVIGIATLVQKAYDRVCKVVPEKERGRIQIGISCALFVPKAQTPFQWCAQMSPEEALRRVQLLRKHIHYRAIRVTWHDPKTSFLEALMSRGDRTCAEIAYRAYLNGARFCAWSEHFNEAAWSDAAASLGVDIETKATRAFDLDEPLPWGHISCGVSPKFLKHDYKSALKEKTLDDCAFGDCTGCGLCPAYGVDVLTQEARR